MKSLYNYLNEARDRIGTLPFTREEFKKFLIAVSDYEDEDPAWKTVEEKVTAEYGEKVWRGLLGWCEGSFYESEPDDLYDILCHMPKDRLTKILGAGSYGAAVELTNGLVCKLYHKNRDMESTERDFFEYCMTHESSVFPRVYKLGPKYVVMEKLKMNTPKCKEYDKYLGFNAVKCVTIKKKQYSIDRLAQDREALAKQGATFRLEGIEKECYDWACRALDELKVACGQTGFSDLRLANIGERADGSIIWFDI